MNEETSNVIDFAIKSDPIAKALSEKLGTDDKQIIGHRIFVAHELRDMVYAMQEQEPDILIGLEHFEIDKEKFESNRPLFGSCISKDVEYEQAFLKDQTSEARQSLFNTCGTRAFMEEFNFVKALIHPLSNIVVDDTNLYFMTQFPNDVGQCCFIIGLVHAGHFEAFEGRITYTNGFATVDVYQLSEVEPPKLVTTAVYTNNEQIELCDYVEHEYFDTTVFGLFALRRCDDQIKETLSSTIPHEHLHLVRMDELELSIFGVSVQGLLEHADQLIAEHGLPPAAT